MPAVAVVAIQLGGGAVDEPDVEVEVTVGVEIAPRRSARFDVVSNADSFGDVLETAVILAIEPVGAAAESDEFVEVAVVVEVGPGIRLPAGHAEQLRLHEREIGSGGLRRQRAEKNGGGGGTTRCEALPMEGRVWHGEPEGNTPASRASTARRRRRAVRQGRKGGHGA